MICIIKFQEEVYLEFWEIKEVISIKMNKKYKIKQEDMKKRIEDCKTELVRHLINKEWR